MAVQFKMLSPDDRRKFVIVVILGILILLGFSWHRYFYAERYSETRMMMATTIQIDVCRDRSNFSSAAAAYSKVWDRLEDIAWRMNVFDERSDVAKINTGFGDPARIGEDTYAVIQQAFYFNELTRGAFDITVLPLIDLWKNGQKTNTIPSLEKIRLAQEEVGAQNIKLLDGYRVKRMREGAKIDLGGIAGGYAVDETVRIFREHGIKNFYIDLGGDMYVGGRNCHGQRWRIGIRDPRGPSKVVDVVALSDAAITTSGDYEKNYEIQGRRWSHIINPMTGYPQGEVVSATVIAPTAIASDAIATALCVLGSEEGTSLIDRLGDTYASLIIVKGPGEAIQQYPSRRYSYFNEK